MCDIVTFKDLQKALQELGFEPSEAGTHGAHVIFRHLKKGVVLSVPHTTGPIRPIYVSTVARQLSNSGIASTSMFQKRLNSSTLQPAAIPAPTAEVADITGSVTPDIVRRMFPTGTKVANIRTNLPHILTALRVRALTDRPMVLTALSTIRAETEGFVPVDERRSKFNTKNKPFDLYEPKSSMGARLGNTQPGDGARFRGRGYVQIAGRLNYERVGRQIGVDLIANPDAANEPPVAGVILAQFLKNREALIRAAVEKNDLLKIRKTVNGASHGFDRFQDTFRKGLAMLPSDQNRQPGLQLNN